MRRARTVCNFVFQIRQHKLRQHRPFRFVEHFLQPGILWTLQPLDVAFAVIPTPVSDPSERPIYTRIRSDSYLILYKYIKLL